MADGPFDEHLVALGYSDGRDGSEHMQQVLLDGPSVSVGGRGGGVAAGPRLSWWSDAHGGLHVNGDSAALDLTLPHGLRLRANVSGARVPWDAQRPDRAGPEGWLARTGLLPCHYFVHTFGSGVEYSLNKGRSARLPRAAHAAHATISGSALAHIERNYGDAFPTGWVWAQAAAPSGKAYVVLTGGRFVIGPLTTESYVIGLRARAEGGTNGTLGGDGELLSWDFRTTDLDDITDMRRPCEGMLAINATSRSGRRRLELVLRARPRSFGAPIYVPTSHAGFSNDPGCRESNTATLTLSAWQTERRGELGVRRLHTEIPLAVLEFGGDRQCP